MPVCLVGTIPSLRPRCTVHSCCTGLWYGISSGDLSELSNLDLAAFDVILGALRYPSIPLQQISYHIVHFITHCTASPARAGWASQKTQNQCQVITPGRGGTTLQKSYRSNQLATRNMPSQSASTHDVFLRFRNKRTEIK